MKTKILLLSMMITLVFGIDNKGYTQAPVVTIVGNYTANPGQTIDIPIQVLNFTDIGAISLMLIYNPGVVTCTGYNQMDTAFSQGFLVVNTNLPGMVALAWFGLQPVSLMDTGIILHLQFTCLGGSCNLVWDIYSCSYASGMGSTFPNQFINGTINGGIPSSACPSLFTYYSGGLTVTFTGFVNGGTPPFDFVWVFGDGSTSTDLTPSHTYSTVNDYQVSLYIIDVNTCTSSYTDTVTSAAFIFDTYGSIDATTPLDTGKVELYYSPGIQPPSTFQLSDSLEINDSYLFSSIPLGYYLIKALPNSSSTFYLTYLPTYYGDTPFWNQADTVSTSILLNPYDIHLVPVPGPAPGPGHLGGVITSGLKMFTTGPPAEGIEIMLTDVNDQPLAVSYSDQYGHFSFDNIAYNTYKVRAEVTGLQTTIFNITLDASNPTDTTIAFEITPNGIIIGIQDLIDNQDFDILALYPNPASDWLKVDIASAIGYNTLIECYNLAGQKVMQRNASLQTGINHLILPTDNFHSGLYLLHLSCPDGTTINRRINIVK